MIERIGLIYGGRDWAAPLALELFMDAAQIIYRLTKVIHGGARGADLAGGWWAETRGIPCQVFNANWLRDGPRRAGPIRNQRMLIEGKPDFGFEFHGPAYPPLGGIGTADMRRRLDRAKIEVIEWKP